MPQSSERLTGICAEIYSHVGKITLQNQQDFEQGNGPDGPMKNGLLIVFSSVTSAGALVSQKLCALPTDRPRHL